MKCASAFGELEATWRNGSHNRAQLRGLTRVEVSFFSTILFTFSFAAALPTIYHVDEESHVAKAVMIPVASTVIPLEDLPVFKVGLGFGLDSR